MGPCLGPDGLLMALVGLPWNWMAIGSVLMTQARQWCAVSSVRAWAVMPTLTIVEPIQHSSALDQIMSILRPALNQVPTNRRTGFLIVCTGDALVRMFLMMWYFNSWWIIVGFRGSYNWFIYIEVTRLLKHYFKIPIPEMTSLHSQNGE